MSFGTHPWAFGTLPGGGNHSQATCGALAAHAAGASIPSIGLGVYQMSPGEETYQAVLNALRVGYRHIDTAQM